MARRRWSDAERQAALDLYRERGPAAAASETGIPAPTISSWASRSGVAPIATANAIAAKELRLATVADRKAALAVGLLDDVVRLRSQLFAPSVERKVFVVSDGHLTGSHAEIVDVHRDEPTFTEKRALMTTIAIAIDKVQILTGEATERIDHRHTDAVDEEIRRLSTELEQRVPA